MQAHLLPLSLADPAVSGVKVGGPWAKHAHRTVVLSGSDDGRPVSKKAFLINVCTLAF